MNTPNTLVVTVDIGKKGNVGWVMLFNKKQFDNAHHSSSHLFLHVIYSHKTSELFHVLTQKRLLQPGNVDLFLVPDLTVAKAQSW